MLWIFGNVFQWIGIIKAVVARVEIQIKVLNREIGIHQLSVDKFFLYNLIRQEHYIQSDTIPLHFSLEKQIPPAV